MKQVVQDLKNGDTILLETPCPEASKGTIVVKTHASLISLGTERMLVNFGKANLYEKARQQPDKVKQVIEKAQTDGILATLDAVKSKLASPLPLGYSNVGVVVDKGEGVTEFDIGDRVASNGAHAQYVRVPINLAAKVPEGVTDEEATFTVLGAIALNGIRLIEPTLGEVVIVIGLGIVGLLCIQILKAHGCRVICLDYETTKCELARSLGFETIDLKTCDSPVDLVKDYTEGAGADAVLIAASTQSDVPMNNAAEMCRKRGRIVQIGTTGLNLKRDPLYKKEISIRVACSYGPGRYDSSYEENGNDYPIGFVRWTTQRNFGAILQLIKQGSLQTKALISHRFPFDESEKAYDVVSTDKQALGIVLQYENSPSTDKKTIHFEALAVTKKQTVSNAPTIQVGIIGSGVFTSRFVMPMLKQSGYKITGVASSGGMNASYYGRKHGANYATSDGYELINDPSVDLVAITTRHNSHANYVVKALEAGKSVYVEKPLCLNRHELNAIKAALNKSTSQFLTVGFNRRFSPFTKKAKQLLEGINKPKNFIMTVNAGELPEDHWHRDLVQGGGRVLAEGCHFIDLLRYLAGSPIKATHGVSNQSSNGGNYARDTFTITIEFEDGSHGTVHYFANGSSKFMKERLEIFVSNRMLQILNFKELRGYSWPGFKKLSKFKQDKGHRDQFMLIRTHMEKGLLAPIPFSEIEEVMEATFQATEAIFDTKL